MTKYHLDLNNKPAVCTADKRPCPRGGEHFKTEEEALFAATDPKRVEAAAKARAAKSVPLPDQSPVEIDTQLSDLYTKIYRTSDNLDRARASEEEYTRLLERDGRFYGDRYREQIVKFQQQIAQFQHELKNLNDEAIVFEKEYERRGRWTRAFLVTNGNGHVHKTRYCSTCRPTTRFAWLPEYSDHAEEEIVNDAGERACTVCYPSAPVDVLKRASKIFTPEEKEQRAAKEKRDAELAKKRAEKQAKAVLDVNGNPIFFRDSGRPTGGYQQELKTERTAEMALVEIRVEQMRVERHGNRWKVDPVKMEVYAEDYDTIVSALARKRGVEPQVVRDLIETKSIAKYKKEGWDSY